MPRVYGKVPASPMRGAGCAGLLRSTVDTDCGPYEAAISYPESVTDSGSTFTLLAAVVDADFDGTVLMSLILAWEDHR